MIHGLLIRVLLLLLVILLLLLMLGIRIWLLLPAPLRLLRPQSPKLIDLSLFCLHLSFKSQQSGRITPWCPGLVIHWYLGFEVTLFPLMSLAYPTNLLRNSLLGLIQFVRLGSCCTILMFELQWGTLLPPNVSSPLGAAIIVELDRTVAPSTVMRRVGWILTDPSCRRRERVLCAAGVLRCCFAVPKSIWAWPPGAWLTRDCWRLAKTKLAAREFPIAYASP
jgi:hypothetical protein